MYCTFCGAVMDNSSVECPMCKRIKNIGESFCKNCGAPRQQGMIFCSECGFQFTAAPDIIEENSQVSAAQILAGSTISSNNNSTTTSQTDTSVNQTFQKQFCRSCGVQIMPGQVVCTACGVKVGQGSSFCPHCAAPVDDPAQQICESCGASLKKAVDVGEYIGSFIGNFLDIFKHDIKTIAFDYGSFLLSAVIFILSLFPIGYIYVSLFGLSETTKFNTWFWPFWGFIYLAAFLISIARFEPHVKNFINKNQIIKDYHIFIVPGMTLISTIFVSIGILSVTGTGFKASVEYASASCGFTFWGVLLVLSALASAGLTTLGYLRKIGKIKI